jgi:hypothetical protein
MEISEITIKKLQTFYLVKNGSKTGCIVVIQDGHDKIIVNITMKDESHCSFSLNRKEIPSSEYFLKKAEKFAALIAE